MVRLAPPPEPPIRTIRFSNCHFANTGLRDGIVFDENSQRIRDAWARLTVREIPGADIYARLPETEVIRCQWCRQPLPNMVARCQVCGGHA